MEYHRQERKHHHHPVLPQVAFLQTLACEPLAGITELESGKEETTLQIERKLTEGKMPMGRAQWVERSIRAPVVTTL